MPAFHPAPCSDVSTYIDFPEDFLDGLYQELLEVRPYFPGDTNVTGHCIDSLIEALERQGCRRSADENE